MAYGLLAVSISLIWFFVRWILEIPSGIPLFSDNNFYYGDIGMTVLGILGIYCIIRG